MKTLLKQTLTLLVIASSLALADADGPDHYKVTGVASNDVLNIRSEADPNANKVGEIPAEADCVKNLGCKGGLTMSEFTDLSKAEQEAILIKRPRWCKIEYQGIKGWVSAHFLSEGSCTKPY
jgi:hypothetical protein